MAENAGAAIVGGGDDGIRAGRVSGGEHGGGNFFGRALSDGADGGTGAAEEGAQRTEGLGGGNRLIQKRDQFFPERLMEMVGESATQRFVLARGKGRGDGTGVSRIFYGVQTIDPDRQQPAGG